MNTVFLRVDPEKFHPNELAQAAGILRRGGIVVFPTETVYGMGVNLDSPEAVARLLDLRRSPKEKQISVHVASVEQASQFAKIPACGAVRRLMRRLWPGPLTIVFPSEDGLGVGIRFPRNRIACELVRQAGVRVGAPSANLAGETPATTAEEARRIFDGKVECVIDGGPTQHRAASTIVRLAGSKIEFLREGAIPKSVVEELTVYTVLFVCSGNTCRSPMAEALFRRMLARRWRVEESELEARGIRILSAGTSAADGDSASDHTLLTMREMGLDINSHRTRGVTPQLLEECDRIFVMTHRHKELVEGTVPECASHVELLDPEGRDIPDPFGGAMEAYRECARRIRESLEKRLEEFE